MVRGMGQGLSCRVSHEHGLFSAVQHGELETVSVLLEKDPSLMHQTTVYDRHSALHIAAANGQIEVCAFSFSHLIFPSLEISLLQYGLIVGFILIELQIVSLLLNGSVNPDVLNRQKQVTSGYYSHLSHVLKSM